MEKYPGNEPKTIELDTEGLSEAKFGRGLRREFFLKPDIIFLNHGSFGAVPRRIFALQSEYNIEREEHPDLWFRINARFHYDKTKRQLAKFIGADEENVVLVNNATTAINTIVKSYPFKTDDCILDNNLTFTAIRHLCCDFTTRLRPDVNRLTLQIEFPIKSEDDVVRMYEEMFNQYPNIKMVILDHISSPSSVLMPVKKLVDLVHKHGAIAVVDGAHAMGQIDLNMEELGADFYTTNLHKWFYTPRGAAILWFDSKHASWLKPSNTSYQIGQSLDKQFFDQGTRDHIPLICARHALQFYNALGGMEKIVNYTKDLADKAQNMMIQELGLKPLPIPPSMVAPSMRVLKLPPFPNFPYSNAIPRGLQTAIFGPSKVFGIITPIEGAFYFRFSAQIYNDLNDFKAGVDVLKKFVRQNALTSRCECQLK